MLNWLANAIGKIGVAIHALSPYPIQPDHCARYDQVEYCYYHGDADSKKVLYFMHGFSYSQEGWTTNFIAGHVEMNWKQTKAPRPHIVTVSKGVWWYTGREHGEELNRFVDGVESLLFDFKPEERILYGESMGGHNALRWSTDFPEKFDRLALSCPAIPRNFVQNPAPSEGFPPWQSLAELLINGNYAVSGQPDYNVLDFTGDTKYPPEVYVIIADRDQFGFLAGGKALIESLEQNPNIHLQWEEQDATHCRPQTEGLAQFLAQ